MSGPTTEVREPAHLPRRGWIGVGFNHPSLLGFERVRLGASNSVGDGPAVAFSSLEAESTWTAGAAVRNSEPAIA